MDVRGRPRRPRIALVRRRPAWTRPGLTESCGVGTWRLLGWADRLEGPRGRLTHAATAEERHSPRGIGSPKQAPPDGRDPAKSRGHPADGANSPGRPRTPRYP